MLEEQTPHLDTYEARTKIRLVVGFILFSVVIVALIVVLRPFLGSGAADNVNLSDLPPADPVGAVPAAPGISKKAAASGPTESEARLVLEAARAFARKNDAANTLKRLQVVVKSYPKTAAAKEAGDALARGEEGLPLFVDAPLVLAKKVTPPLAPEPPPPVVVEATTSPKPPPGAASAELAPGVVTPEPYVKIDLPRETAEIPPKPLPAGFRAHAEAGVHKDTGWPLEITGDKDGAPMVLVPGGTFLMGRDNGPAVERPAHRVTLSPYFIDQHEVTVRQYRWFLQATGRKLPAEAEADAQRGPDWPMVRVTARDAKDYADWTGKSLPTEAQWEMAARTPDGRLHPWGSAPPGWSKPRKPGQIDPVESFPLDLSPYGVFDLAGNVREWTADWFDARYFQQFLTTPSVDPQGPPRSRSRSPGLTIKGGSPTWDASCALTCGRSRTCRIWASVACSG